MTGYWIGLSKLRHLTRKPVKLSLFCEQPNVANDVQTIYDDFYVSSGKNSFKLNAMYQPGNKKRNTSVISFLKFIFYLKLSRYRQNEYFEKYGSILYNLIVLGCKI